MCVYGMCVMYDHNVYIFIYVRIMCEHNVCNVCVYNVLLYFDPSPRP